MENTKKSSEFEPTLLDVLEAVQTGFTKMEKRFEKVEKQLDRHEGILITLHEGQEGLRELLNERTSALDKRVSATQNRSGKKSRKKLLSSAAPTLDQTILLPKIQTIFSLR